MPDRKEKYEKIMEELEDCPVIAAVKDEKGLEECLNMDVGMVFVLYGTVCTIGEIVKRIKRSGKSLWYILI